MWSRYTSPPCFPKARPGRDSCTRNDKLNRAASFRAASNHSLGRERSTAVMYQLYLQRDLLTAATVMLHNTLTDWLVKVFFIFVVLLIQMQ